MKRESGVTMVEYVMLVTLIAVALAATVMFFQRGVSENLGESVDCLESIGDGGGAVDCPGVVDN
ncbi:MAG: hypothetical protein ABFS08_02485 [Pseudomonadota bacterium]